VSAEPGTTAKRAGAAEAPARPRGRPRSKEADEAILMATLRLLPEHGLNLTIEAVAAEAGVGKTTIYRRWENKHALVADAVSVLPPPPASLPDSGSLQGDLEALAAAQRARLGHTPVPRIIPRLLADSGDDPALHAVLLERAVEPFRVILRGMVERAIGRGELRDDLDVETVVDVLHAVPLYKILMAGGSLEATVPLPGAFIPMLLEGVAPRQQS
jgi:AcrR family transcriptional regulator